MRKKLFVVLFAAAFGLILSCAKKEEAPKPPATQEMPADTMQSQPADTMQVAE